MAKIPLQMKDLLKKYNECMAQAVKWTVLVHTRLKKRVPRINILGTLFLYKKVEQQIHNKTRLF